MKSIFRGYYAPDGDELNNIWTNGLIVLDTNALLNLFRYSHSTRNEFLAVLESFQDALWIPHQVGLEFHRRRLDVINQQERAFDEIDNSLATAKNEVSKALKKFDRHPSLNAAGMTESLELHIGEISKLLAAAREQHASSVLADGENDRTFDLVTDLYEGRVGNAFPAERLQATYDAGKKRYEAKMPPGFKDSDKPEPDRYGDLVLWQQVLEHGGTTKKPTIFVTDDAKEDWWYIVSGKTQGPRVELVDEYFAAAQERIHFYTPDRFLTYAKEWKGSAVSDESLTEVEEVSSARSTALAVSVLRERQQELEEQRMRMVNRVHHEQARAMRERPSDAEAELGILREEASLVQERLEALDTELEALNAYVTSEDEREVDPDIRLHWTRLRHERAEVRQQYLAIRDATARHLEQARVERPGRPSAAVSMRRAEHIGEQLAEVERALRELGE